jgi:hypothetical protein
MVVHNSIRAGQVRSVRPQAPDRHAHALHVLNTVDPTTIPATADNSERGVWIGQDDRGVELEIVGVVEPDLLLIIHVMSTYYRR